jgi:hypothetical protein
MKSIFLRSHLNQLHSYNFHEDDNAIDSIEFLKEAVLDTWGIPVDQQTLFHNGRIIHDLNSLQRLESGSVINVSLGLQGGKGGFGSLLRGQAISKRKITNFDASRDLQGRRIRNVKNMQKLAEWVKKRKEEEKLIKKEVDEYNKKQKEIASVQKDIRLTQEFKDKVEKWDTEMSSSIKAGLKKTKLNENGKRENGDYQHDDFVEPMQKKKLFTEEDKSSTIEKDANDDTLNGKISQKLAAILGENGKQNEEEAQTTNGKPAEEKVLESEKKSDSVEYSQIDLATINSVDDLIKLGPDHLKLELMRLGLKCGGSLQDRAKRLYDIKLKPELLFNPKYIAKK